MALKYSVVITFFTCVIIHAQASFTLQDTLRGSITPERAWWDLTYYDLDIQVFPETKTISGKNTIGFTVLDPKTTLQIDLQAPLKLTKALLDSTELDIKQIGAAHFISLPQLPKKGSKQTITVYYEGKPKVAKRPPWDGGITWAKDANGNDFIASSCQGIGASIWWPNKDHMYDEVDSMDIRVRVPKDLKNISNGRLIDVKEHDDNTTTYHWFVSNPINNYGVNINIGDYVHFSEVYKGEKGLLDMDYYVLRDNLEKAKIQFKDAPKLMKAFEYWFGPYPFYEDSYKLVEAPYLGMEHQSSVTYGNKYKNGYLGRDLSGSGWGMKFDFIIIHESGHEWFANNITNKDNADLWIHEGFTSYSESLFLNFYYGKKAASEYVIGLRKNITNYRPIIGTYGVNKTGSGDMYPKGANMLHTLRYWINDDEKWRGILRGLNTVFYHQTITTQEIEAYISEQSGLNLESFFNQYLRTTKIPQLNYTLKNNSIEFKYTNVVPGFEMPIKVTVDGESIWLYPTEEWKVKRFSKSVNNISIDKNFYINSKKI